MNEAVDKFGSNFDVLGFPCNQFGKQEGGKPDEILRLLQHVRPGHGFETKIHMMAKGDINGSEEQPIWTWLKDAQPLPSDQDARGTIMKNARDIIWSPVKRSDVAWNFEKFLVGKDGTVLSRYSRDMQTKDIAKDIEAALKA
jgi:glutathione peroxidase